MAASSVGQIGLDLVVNKNGFEKQMNGILGMAKKAGAALAAAFAVKKIADFASQCIELGSDLAEVQNVVDVTFPGMSKQVDKFARNAAASFGLSETMAKRFTGTFGSMAKAFGFNEQAAYGMSTALTGLAGDVASFYNISQDEAYTKMKAVFTGESEVLKDLGIVMTQTSLDAYAMANGYGKTTAKMSEAEKVALRYKFVQEQLTGASGDFLRTSGGWANQVRVLKLQFDSLKATIGQGLINVLTPVIKVINTLIGKLATAASAFKAFTELVMGKKAAAGTAAIADATADAEQSAGGLADNTQATADAAKAAKKGLSGIDKLNVISSSGDSAGAGGTVTASPIDYGELVDGEDILNNVDKTFQKLIEKAKELAGIFKQGFFEGFANVGAFDSIANAAEKIKNSFQDLFSDPAVTGAVDQYAEAFLHNLGKITGSVVSIGVTIAENLIGGFQLFLEQNSGYIKERIVQIFDAEASISESFGTAFQTIADVFTAFSNEDGKQITADIIGIFADAGLGVLEAASRFVADWANAVIQPIEANKDKIKTAVENTLAPLATVTSSIRDLISNTFSKVSEVFDTYIDPAFEKFKDGWNSILSAALDAYNTYLAPVLDWISERFSLLVSDYVQPLMDAFIELWGACMDAMATFWEFISPFVGWFVQQFIITISANLQLMWSKFEYVFRMITDIMTGFIRVLGGVIDFIVGAFTGDWDRAWSGVQKIISGVWETIQKLVQNALDFIKNIVDSVMTTVDNLLGGRLTSIKDTWNKTWENMRKSVEDTFNGIWGFLKNIINLILGGIEKMANGVVKAVNKIIDVLNNLKIDIPDGVPFVGGLKLGFDIEKMPSVKLPRLAQGGFVKANTPQLAMIGDNRHQGEVVAPEDKLQELLNKAVQQGQGNGLLTLELLSLLRDMLGTLQRIEGKESGPVITDRQIFDAWRRESRKQEQRYRTRPV